PRPLNKTADERWPLSVQVSQKKRGTSKATLVHVDGGRRFDVQFEIPDDERRPLTGTVAVGRRAFLPASGLSVAVKADTLVWNDWEKPLKDLLASAAKGTGDAPNPLRSVDVSAGKITVDGTVLEQLTARYTRDGNNAQTLDLSSSAFSARAAYEGRAGIDDRVTLSAEKLHLTGVPFEALQRFLSGSDKSEMRLPLSRVPDLLVHARDVAFDDKRFGDVVLSTHTVRGQTLDEVVIDRLTVAGADAQLTGKGRWSGKKGAAFEETFTEAELDLKLDNTGKLLDSLGIAGVIEGARGTGKATIHYSGAPWSPDLSTLSGTTSLNLRGGSFVQIDTGAGGALLSILSFQSLLKRLTLDFNDLVHDGLAFDTFSGTSEIRNGVGSTDNTKISGTHGTVLISGQADLANRFLSNRVVFLPDLNAGNASLALTLVNPAVGIGTFLAQMLLRGSLSEMFKVEYSITGTFENPKIEKIESR
ncbi:MAG: YhdP family protein, partial [Duodenibacillus sp.]